MTIQVGSRVQTKFGTGIVIHPYENLECFSTVEFTDSADLVDIFLDQAVTTPALHGQTFTTRFVVVLKNTIFPI